MANINQIYTILNMAARQAWGSEALQVTNLSTLVAMGDYVLSSQNAASKDAFTGALTDIIGKSIYVNRPLTIDDLGITADQMQWGGIVRKVRVKPKELKHNTEYDLADQEFNPFDIEVPEVKEMLFSKYGTYESLVTITDKQLFTAFQGEEELQAFYSLIYKQLYDAIYRGEHNHNKLALVNFIAEKFKLQETQQNKKHAINILAMYNADMAPAEPLTVAKMYTDPEFLRYFGSKLIEFKGYMRNESDIFNASEGYVSQTTEEYLKMFVLKSIDARFAAYLYSNTYHDELIKLDGYKTVDFWQAMGDLTPASTSAINVRVASDDTQVEKANILAVMMDRDAVATYYKTEKEESWRVPTKGTNHYKSVTTMMINDMFENGIVFYAAD